MKIYPNVKILYILLLESMDFSLHYDLVNEQNFVCVVQIFLPVYRLSVETGLRPVSTKATTAVG